MARKDWEYISITKEQLQFLKEVLNREGNRYGIIDINHLIRFILIDFIGKYKIKNDNLILTKEDLRKDKRLIKLCDNQASTTYIIDKRKREPFKKGTITYDNTYDEDKRSCYIPIPKDIMFELNEIVNKEGRKYGIIDKSQLARTLTGDFIERYEIKNNNIKFNK
jgi:hypothetical protein